MQSMKRRRVLKSLAASGIVSGATGVSSAHPGLQPNSMDVHGGVTDRPDVVILNNRGQPIDVDVVVRNSQTDKVFTTGASLNAPKARSGHGPFRTAFDLPQWRNRELDFELLVDGEPQSNFSYHLGERGFPDLGSIHVDLRPDHERVGYSVI